MQMLIADEKESKLQATGEDQDIEVSNSGNYHRGKTCSAAFGS